MHNGFLQVEGEKMSKSLGNFITIRQLFDGWRDFRWTGEAIKLAMLSTHYRQPIDWTVQKLEQADIFLGFAKKFARPSNQTQPSKAFVDALSDDLNTPQVFAILHELLEQAKHQGHAKPLDPDEPMPLMDDEASEPARQLSANLSLLGINLKEYKAAKHVSEDSIDRPHVEASIEARIAARKAKNWAEADRIRDELVAMGIVLMDAKDPETGEIVTTWEIAR
jgi:cysteinyl-tRNA synthetase